MRNFSVFAIFLFFIGIVKAQVPDSNEYQLKLDKAIELQKAFQPKASLDVLQSLLPEVKKHFDSGSKIIGKIYYQIASAKLDLAQYDEAKKLLDQSLQIFKSYDSIFIELGNTYMLIGIYYDYMTDYDKALAYYDLTKTIYLELLPLNDYRFSYLYNNMGICIYFQGDIERALNFFNKALAITMENFGLHDIVLSKELNNISFCYSANKKTKASKDALDLSSNIVNQNKLLNTRQGANINHSLALIHYNLKNFDKTLMYLDRAYQIRIKKLPKTHPEIASTYFMMGNTYIKTKQAKKAKEYFTKALDIYTQTFGENHPEIAIVHSKLGKTLLEEGFLKNALSHVNKALSIFNYDENILLSNDNKFNLNILKALDLKAQIHYKLWIEKNNILQLKKANHTYSNLISILNNFRKSFKEKGSKEVLANDFFHIFDNAIETSYALFEASQNKQFLKDAFIRCEYSSSFILLEDRRYSKAKHTADIPDSLLQIEQQIRIEITSLEKKKRTEEKRTQKDRSKIIQLASQIFDLKEKLYTVVQEFETEFPKYRHHKSDITTVSIEKLQSFTLDEDQVILEYFVGEKNLFIFIISKENFIVEKIAKDFPLEFWVEDLRQKIIEFQFPFNLDSDYHDKLITYSEAIYWEIFNPIEKHLKERITIIPGGVLAKIPFECLIKNTDSDLTKYKKHEYLIQDYAISYCYSATLLDEMVSNRKTKSNHKGIAFAPSFNKFGQSSNLRDLLLLPLEFNTPEVQDIANIIDAKAVVDAEATEDYFIEQSQKYSILHFATHAKVNDTNSDFSFLAFSEVEDSLENELLFVKDIYNIPLQSEMITLSACETGIGENRKGEGVISLARGFSSTGTGNINTSLWNVNDAKMAKLMKLFYQNIAEGVTKDQALRKAKQTFIAKYNDNMQVHPFFWTAMISIGDMQAIPKTTRSNSLFWFSALIGILCLGWWINKNKSLIER